MSRFFFPVECTPQRVTQRVAKGIAAGVVGGVVVGGVVGAVLFPLAIPASAIALSTGGISAVGGAGIGGGIGGLAGAVCGGATGYGSEQEEDIVPQSLRNGALGGLIVVIAFVRVACGVLLILSQITVVGGVSKLIFGEEEKTEQLTNSSSKILLERVLQLVQETDDFNLDLNTSSTPAFFQFPDRLNDLLENFENFFGRDNQ